MALNPRQAKFARLYHLHRVATRAYAEAYGVRDDIAGTAGHRLLKNVQVQKAITKLEEGAEIRSELKKKDLIDRLAAIIDSRPNEAATDNALCELSGMGIPVFPGKLQAMTLLSRLIGAEKANKVELTADSEVVEMLRGLTGAREKDL